MKGLFAMITVSLVWLIVACSTDGKYETCDGVTITPASTNIQVRAINDPFYCKEMEEIFDIDAETYVKSFVEGVFLFTHATSLSSDSSTCIEMDAADIPASYPEDIKIGALVKCLIGKAPRNETCADTFELTFATEDGGELMIHHRVDPRTLSGFAGFYKKDPLSDPMTLLGPAFPACFESSDDGNIYVGSEFSLPQSASGLILYKWLAPLPPSFLNFFDTSPV
ncbi:MAG TPA: hypothetical protein P5077_08600 [bacterium]|nr:hypothetical protein [bacterium]